MRYDVSMTILVNNWSAFFPLVNIKFRIVYFENIFYKDLSLELQGWKIINIKELNNVKEYWNKERLDKV